MNTATIWVDRETNLPESLRGCVLSIGKFDGVHLGHQKIANTCIKVAERLGTKAIAVTFDPAPITILRPDLKQILPLTPLNRKVDLLKKAGFADVAVFRTGCWLLELEARAFFDEIICNRFQACGLVEGPNFSFGKNRGGTAKDLLAWSKEVGIHFEQIEPLEFESTWVTSSRIRNLIQNGDLGAAHKLLGHAFVTRGKVVHGAGRGRTIGIPTANLGSCDTILPKPGVYAASACIIEDETCLNQNYAAAVNIGEQPTFDSRSDQVEAHLIAYQCNEIYGKLVELTWLERIRETQRFSSVDELKSQIFRDIETVQGIFQARKPGLWTGE